MRAMAVGAAAAVDRARLAREAGPRPRATRLILRYDIRRFPFAALLSRDVFGLRDLGRLHEALAAQRRAEGRPDRRPTHRDNLALRAMMERLPEGAGFWRLYHGFMLGVLAPLVGRGISYSSRPKMRVHLAGTPSVSSFHHDICVTGRVDQVNFWMPFADALGDAALWLESDYGRGDFAPVPLRYGEVLVFDGGYLGHGSVANGSDRTRVSLDMRFSFKGAATRAEGVALMDRLAEVLPEPKGDPP